MAVFRVEKTRDYTVMSNHHLKNRSLSLKAKGLMSLMLSLPDDWDYTLKGLAKLCCDGVDSVRNAVVQLETEGYIMRRQGRDAHGRLSANEYVVYEVPQQTKPVSDLPLSENPTTEKPTTDIPLSENPTQSITKKPSTQEPNTYLSKYPSINPSARGAGRMDVMDERDSYREMILENIEYDIIADRNNRERLDEMVEIMLDAVCSSKDTLRIILRIIVQTHFKVFFDDWKLKFDGFQPLSVGFALLVYLNLVDKGLNELPLFSLIHNSIQLIKINQNLMRLR